MDTNVLTYLNMLVTVCIFPSACKDVLVKLHSLATCVAVTYFFPAEMVQVAMKTIVDDKQLRDSKERFSQ